LKDLHERLISNAPKSKKIAKGKRARGLKGKSPGRGARNTKPVEIVPIVAGIVAPIGRTAIPWSGEPRAASSYLASSTIVLACPSAAIFRCPFVITMPVILAPFPDIAVHVE
jgi:hypothetical protein